MEGWKEAGEERDEGDTDVMEGSDGGVTPSSNKQTEVERD